jgi:6-phosphogluconolactonase
VPRAELILCADEASLARSAAAAWLDKIVVAARAGRPHLVALAGGRNSERFFGCAVESAHSRRISFATVHFFWSDERCVPPNDPESNFASAGKLLLRPLGIEPDHIHRLEGEAEPASAAARGEAELGMFATTDAAGVPVLDLVFLGLGEDGHVASLFPETAAGVAEDRATYLPVIGPKPPKRRLTLSYAALAAAGEVWVLAGGPSKAPALEAALSPGTRTPLGNLLQLRSTTRIYSAHRPTIIGFNQ